MCSGLSLSNTLKTAAAEPPQTQKGESLQPRIGSVFNNYLDIMEILAQKVKVESAPTMPSRSRPSNLISWAVLIATVLISASFILSDSGVVPAPPMDQHFAETVDLHLTHTQGHWAFHYPSLQNSGGITSSLIAGVYKLLIPTSSTNLNWHIRIFAMATYLTSSFFLFRTFIVNRPLQILAYLIIASSGFQFLQPSSDLFSGTLLNLFFIAATARWPRIWTSLFLATFGLCKVDMILAAIALAIFWAIWEHKSKQSHSERTLVFTLLWLAIFLMPGFIFHGANPFGGSRSTIAFLSAYAEFFSYHQFHGLSGSDLGKAMESARINIFGGSESFVEIVRRYPSLYFDFVGVSAARSLPNIVNVFKLMLIPIAIVYLRQRDIKANKFLLWGALIAAICVILPAWLVIYLRLRYAVKIAVPLIAIALTGSLELSRQDRRYLQVAWACGIGSILWQLYWFRDMAIYSHWK